MAASEFGRAQEPAFGALSFHSSRKAMCQPWLYPEGISEEAAMGWEGQAASAVLSKAMAGLLAQVSGNLGNSIRSMARHFEIL